MVVPTIYFTNIVGLTGSTYSAPYDTTMGDTFNATFSLGTYSSIDVFGGSQSLTSQIVSSITDNRDGVILLMSSNVIVKDITSATVSSISLPGTYSMTFNFSDIAGNYVNPSENVIITLIP